MGLSLRDTAMALASIGDLALDALQVVDATALAAQYYPHLDPDQATLIVGIRDLPVAARVQQTLIAAYPPEHSLVLIDGKTARSLTLRELGSLTGIPSSACLLVSPLRAAASYEALQDVIAHLRAPDGCPWDRALTWAKLRATLLEETYELLSALDAEDPTKVSEELGDLLLQIAMQTQIASEDGQFRLPDVIARVVDKLIRRHPHVFGDAVVSGTDEVLANWEAIKRAERAQNGEQRSPLAGVPNGLPALAQAHAYLDRMSRLRDVDAPDKPWERLDQLPPDMPVTPETVGEALFGLVAWAAARGIDAESALRKANARYAAQVAAEELG